MEKPTLQVTGLNGLVGTRIQEILKDQFVFENISRSTGVDITNFDQIDKALSESSAQTVLHLAAKTDVDACEKDKELGSEGEAYKINVEGTRNVTKAASLHHKKLIYVSTDFVFNGVKPQVEYYTEEDTPDPINWYGQTKYEGEKIVAEYTNSLILRISSPYRAQFEKRDFVRSVLSKLQSNQPVTMVDDHIFTPTFIDDIAYALSFFVKNQEKNGVFHVVGSQALSPFEAGLSIARVFGANLSLVSKTTREEFFQGRAPRPFNLSMKNDKILQLGVAMRTFEEGLEEIKKQLAQITQ